MKDIDPVSLDPLDLLIRMVGIDLRSIMMEEVKFAHEPLQNDDDKTLCLLRLAASRWLALADCRFMN